MRQFLKQAWEFLGTPTAMNIASIVGMLVGLFTNSLFVFILGLVALMFANQMETNEKLDDLITLQRVDTRLNLQRAAANDDCYEKEEV